MTAVRQLALYLVMVLAISGSGIEKSASQSESRTSGATKIIVGFPPGGLTDVIARALAHQITAATRQAFIVENHPGAGTAIATEAVARAAPDGKTVLFVGNTFLINSHLRSLPYDPLSSFDPVCSLVEFPQVLVVNSASSFGSLSDFLLEAKRRPAQLSFAAAGPGLPQHLSGQILMHLAAADVTYVPYPGASPAISALLGNHVTAVIANYGEVQAQIESGEFRPLVTTAATRIPRLPAVPTVKELGYDAAQATVWQGLVVPAHTPKPIVAELATSFTSALLAPAVQANFVNQGVSFRPSNSSEFGRLLKEQYDYYRDYIRDLKIKAE